MSFPILHTNQHYQSTYIIPCQHQPQHQTMQFLDAQSIPYVIPCIPCQHQPHQTYVIPCILCQHQVNESLAVGSFTTQSDFEYQNVAFNPNNYENNLQEIINMSFSQTLLNDNYDELNRGLQNKRRDTRAEIKVNFKLFCLPYGDLTPKIPRKVTKLHSNFKKSTCFDDDSDYGIRKKIETLFPHLKGNPWQFFRCKSTSDLEIAPEPINGWSISELKHIAGSRKKLYLGTINGPPIQPITQTTIL